ncbi:hypothetical protein MMC07_001484 [Pseudocyphellaria aurata]|nr:hypothetical protein [Pseudocyphellaria aurata]
MPPSELIDLSLSTDDEKPLRPSPRYRGRVASEGPVDTEFRCLESDLENAVSLDESWTAHVSKKRKISPPLDREDGLEADSAAFGSWRSKARTLQKKSSVEEPDCIISTPHDRISAPLPEFRDAVRPTTLVFDGSDDSFPEDVIHGRLPQAKQHPLLSERTVALLESFDKPTKSKKVKGVGQRSKENITESRRSISPYSAEQETDLVDTAKPKAAKSSTTVKHTNLKKAEERENSKNADKARKAIEKEEEQKRKRALKEEEHKLKRLLKEEKAREKQRDAALAEVNKSKLDKKITGPEMIVDLPASIDGQGVDTQIRAFLKNLQIEATSYQSPLPNIIKWRRKVKSHYNEQKGHWEPIQPMQIEDENHVMCLMSAKEFVALASANSHQRDVPSLEAHVTKLKSEFDSCKPIYLIEGWTSWMRKNKTTLNRAYQAAVLNQMDSLENTALGRSEKSTSRRKNADQEHVDADMIEDALLRLQVMNGCLVHHTAITVETAEWVANFTQHISTIPSRMERVHLDTSFCMESGQVKAGEDKNDTYVKMLQEVVRVTAPIAYGIAAEYPNVKSLVRGLRRHGPLALEDIEKCANKNGARTERRIGPAISKRIYKVFMELDPMSTDI